MRNNKLFSVTNLAGKASKSSVRMERLKNEFSGIYKSQKLDIFAKKKLQIAVSTGEVQTSQANKADLTFYTGQFTTLTAQKKRLAVAPSKDNVNPRLAASAC